jgi:hypothetical protein
MPWVSFISDDQWWCSLLSSTLNPHSSWSSTESSFIFSSCWMFLRCEQNIISSNFPLLSSESSLSKTESNRGRDGERCIIIFLVNVCLLTSFFLHFVIWRSLLSPVDLLTEYQKKMKEINEACKRRGGISWLHE